MGQGVAQRGWREKQGKLRDGSDSRGREGSDTSGVTPQLSKLRTEMTIGFGDVFRGLQGNFSGGG